MCIRDSCESFITFVIGHLMRKCWHHILLFTVMSQLVQWFINRLCSFSLEVVRGRQSDFEFFLAGEGAPESQTAPVIKHFGIFSETHPKQSQRDVSLREWWPVGMPGFVKIQVVSNVGWEKRTSICGNIMASSSMVIAKMSACFTIAPYTVGPHPRIFQFAEVKQCIFLKFILC